MAHVKHTTTIGRRKSASARVSLSVPAEGEGKIVVNERAFEHYFPAALMQQLVLRPIEVTERVGRYNFDVKVVGGGTSGQAGAVVHGIARALQKHEPELRPVLKKAGLLTRDPRVVERKKPGRHKARKSTQYSKR